MGLRTYRDLRPTFADQAEWNLPRILRHRAETHGARTYLDAPQEGLTLTYAETLARAQQLASGLLAHGEPGDRVLIMSSNRSEVILSWFAASLAGMVEVPINTAYSGSFLEHQVRTTRPRIAVVEAEFAERFAERSEAYSSIERFYVLGAGSERDACIRGLRVAGYEAESWDDLSGYDPAQLPAVAPEQLASIFFTSGTTGLSKGVMMPHAHMTWFADECVSLTRLTDADAFMSVGPLFHGNAQFLAAYPALIAGARFVLQERFSASRWIDQIRDSGATVTNFVGVMMDWTWKQPERPDDADNQLRCIFACPTASSILSAYKRRFGVEAFVEVFGLTETSMPILAPYGEERPPGAAGLLADEYYDIRLVDPDTDREVDVGEVGELVVRTKLPWTMCAGYYNMAEKTVEAWRNLWFHTGDGLKRDADGWYYFVDRLKDAIRRRGENISSYEVEQAVLGHPDVVECAVVAAPAASEAGEDEVAVFVVVANESPIDVAEVRAWCERRLPAFARPEYVEIVDELPLTPSGKVRKIELRERAEELARAALSAQADDEHGRYVDRRGAWTMSKTLLEREENHPQTVIDERDGRSIVIMDSARWVDPRNTEKDVVVPASYIGVLPARMVAIHRPRGVIGHDACVGKDGAGIAGLWYLEALGIPAATADGMTAEMGNGADLYENGVISHLNYPAERCGVQVGMSVREAAALLRDVDPTDVEVSNKIRREIVEQHPSGRRTVVTDSIVWALPEDEGVSVLVTAGHTGRSGASFLLEANPWGFICHDGGMSKNRSGVTGLKVTAEHKLAGACIDGNTAPIGDAFRGYAEGLISVCNEPAEARGVRAGMPVKEAAHLLLVGGDG